MPAPPFVSESAAMESYREHAGTANQFWRICVRFYRIGVLRAADLTPLKRTSPVWCVDSVQSGKARPV